MGTASRGYSRIAAGSRASRQCHRNEEQQSNDLRLCHRAARGNGGAECLAFRGGVAPPPRHSANAREGEVEAFSKIRPFSDKFGPADCWNLRGPCESTACGSPL